MAMLLDLPNEILYCIAGYLTRELDINSLVRTNRHFYNLINAFLYYSNAMHGQMSALLWASNHGIFKTAQYSLDASVRVSTSKLGTFYNALFAAVRAGHTSIAKILLSQEGIDPNFQYQSEEDESVMTLLARAAQADIDPNLGDDMGRSLIAYAGLSGQDAVVQQLLASPAVDLNLKDRHGRTPLSWTVGHGSEAAVSQFLSRPDVDVNAAIVINWGFIDKVKLLLNIPHINADHQCGSGKTALHLAARIGSEVIVQLLLARGVNPDPRNRHNKLSLYKSAFFGHLLAIKLLYEAGADPDTVTDDEDTALAIASSSGYTDLVAFLLETGRVALARPGKHDKRNSLSWAAERGYREIAGLLIQYGEDINTKDHKRRTPLSYAVEHGNVEIVKMLLLNSSSIDPMEMDAEGETLFSRVSRHNDPDILNLLASFTGTAE
ncbi:ankyrin repeat-containing domain protein [Aspergillus leporis]|uniref:Ankyrin repeat-containing domain protein n=1 Tax=Aspergillus leporis TaxID=41062 RepID=A0A5N5WLW4_9EURO|nr:ankyrin repeat-containing domain protein [Aspergillus leporis]